MNYLNDLAVEIRKINQDNGWDIPSRDDVSKNPMWLLGVMMLIVTEVAESAEEVRINQPDCIGEELVDVLLRTLDLMAGLEVDIDKVLAAKMEKNRQRTYRHGGKLA